MRLVRKLEYTERNPGGSIKYFGVFYCEFCQQEVIKPMQNGLVGKSCGCNQRLKGPNNHFYKHGGSYTKLFEIWGGMLNRTDPDTKHEGNRKWYLERGITVCDEWRNDFAKFRDWAEPLYQPGLLLDRIDNDKGYCPDNCRFVTPEVSANNTRRMLHLQQTLPKIQEALDNEWSNTKIYKTYGVSQTTIKKYIDNGTLIRKPKSFNGTERIKELIPHIQQMINEGYTSEEIREMHGVHKKTIRGLIKRGLIKDRPSLFKHVRELLPRIQELINSGHSIERTAQEVKLDRKTVYKLIKQGYIIKHENKTS